MATNSNFQFSKEDVQVTLWGDIARTIDVDAIKAAAAPALAVFSSLKVNKYQSMSCEFQTFNINLIYKRKKNNPISTTLILQTKPSHCQAQEPLHFF